MPQVPTLQPNVGLDVGTARLQPPSTNIEAYGYGNAGNALMGLGAALSDAAIARQARINAVATLQARNNLQLQLEGNMREQYERKGENALERPAVGDDDPILSVSDSFSNFSRNALAGALSTLHNETQRRTLQQWYDEAFPTYYNKIATYQQQQLEQWEKDTADASITGGKRRFIASALDGDAEGMEQGFNQSLASVMYMNDVNGRPINYQKETESELAYEMLSDMTDEFEKAGRTKESRIYIDKYYKDGRISKYHYKMLEDKIAGGELADEARTSLQDLIAQNPDIFNEDGTLNDSKATDLIDKASEVTRQVSGEGGDEVSQVIQGISYVEEKSGDYYAVNERSGAFGRYQMTDGFVQQWAEAAGYPEITDTASLRNAPNSPEIQDAIMRAAASANLKKYGVDGAIIAHYLGPGTAEYYVNGSPTYPDPTIEPYGSKMITWDDPVENGAQPSANEYLAEAHERMGYQTVTEIDERKKEALMAEYEEYKQNYNAQRSSALANATQRVLQFAPTAREQGYTRKEIIDQMGAIIDGANMGGHLITEAQKRNLLQTGLRSAGLVEQAEKQDEQDAVSSAIDDVLAGRYKNLAEVRAAFGTRISEQSYAKIGKMFERQDGGKTQTNKYVQDAMKSVINDNPEIFVDGRNTYVYKIHMAEWPERFYQENGREPTAEEIWKEANDAIQPVSLGYGYRTGFLGFGSVEEVYTDIKAGAGNLANATRVDRRDERKRSYFEHNGVRSAMNYDDYQLYEEYDPEADEFLP